MMTPTPLGVRWSASQLATCFVNRAWTGGREAKWVTRRASLDSPRVRPPGRYRHAAGINTADQVEVHPPHEPGMLVGDRVERQLTSVMTSSLTRPHGCAWLVTAFTQSSPDAVTQLAASDSCRFT